jgi:transcriptional regulator with XRE-family HTH domain
MNYEEHKKFLIKKLYKGNERITITKKMSLFLKKERKKTFFSALEIAKMIGITRDLLVSCEDMRAKTVSKATYIKLEALYKDFQDGKIRPKYILNTKDFRIEWARKRTEIKYHIIDLANELNIHRSIICSIEAGELKYIKPELFDKFESLYQSKITYQKNGEILGIILKNARKNLKLTGLEVAKKLNISMGLVSLYENGQVKNINKDIIDKMETLYGICTSKTTFENVKIVNKPLESEKISSSLVLNTEDLRNELAMKRKKLNYYILDVEKMLDITQDTVSKIESGELKYIPSSLVKKIESLYQEKMDELEVVIKNKILGSYLLEARNKNKLTRFQVTEKLNICATTIRKYELGRVNKVQKNLISKFESLYREGVFNKTIKKVKKFNKYFADEKVNSNFILNTTDIRNELIRKREEIHYYIFDVSNKLDIPQDTISEIESGKLKYIPALLLEKIESLYQAKSLEKAASFHKVELDKIELVEKNKKLGNYLREARLKKRLTMRQVAEKLNVSYSSIRDYEMGDVKKINSDLVDKIKKIYKIK